MERVMLEFEVSNVKIKEKYLFQGIVAADFPLFFTGRFLEN